VVAELLPITMAAGFKQVPLQAVIEITPGVFRVIPKL
jgi:hypothetical protein